MKLKIFFALLLAACSLSASAEAYLGLSAGAADYNDSLWSVEAGANDVGWKLTLSPWASAIISNMAG